MPTSFLLAFVPLQGHKDPDFRIPIYGDSGSRGESLQRNVEPGSYLFFHTNLGGAKYITGYIQVERTLSRAEAQATDFPVRCDAVDDDWCFVGAPATSRSLAKPLLFDRNLAQQLSLGIDFTSLDQGLRSEVAVLGSATRPPRRLTDADVTLLLAKAAELQRNLKISNSEVVARYLTFQDERQETVPFDEVHQVKERELQLLLRRDPVALGQGLRVIAYEKLMPDGDRLDLLLEDSIDGALVVAELKAPGQATDAVAVQVASYASDIKQEYSGRTVRKMIVCDGRVSPKLRKACHDLGIELRAYGWKLSTVPLVLD